MDYTRKKQESKFVEKMGYVILTSGIGAIVYGMCEKDPEIVGIGVGNVLSGIGISYMGKGVRNYVEESERILSGDLERVIEN